MSASTLTDPQVATIQITLTLAGQDGSGNNRVTGNLAVAGGNTTAFNVTSNNLTVNVPQNTPVQINFQSLTSTVPPSSAHPAPKSEDISSSGVPIGLMGLYFYASSVQAGSDVSFQFPGVVANAGSSNVTATVQGYSLTIPARAITTFDLNSLPRTQAGPSNPHSYWLLFSDANGTIYIFDPQLDNENLQPVHT